MAARAKRKKKFNSRQVAFTRFMLIVAVFVLWIGGISARLVHLQVNQHEWLKEKAVGQRQDVTKSKLLRGTIFDRNGRALAISVNVQTLYADATQIEDIPKAAKQIAKVLRLNERELAAELNEAKSLERKFVPLAKGLDGQAVDAINKKLNDPDLRKADSPRFAGLHWRGDQKRSYPHQSLASHIIGFSNAEGVGQAGIEQSQNDELYGAVIKRLQERDRLGRIYDETVSEKAPPKDVVLTISNSLQFKVEEALAKAVQNSGARSGMAIVISNKTGEVMALANYPTFDPNDLGSITSENLPNGAIQNVYSPGSVFKLITYGTALEKKLITPEGLIDSGNGTIEVAKHKFRDSHAIGTVTYTKALAHSSNVCAIKTALRVGREDFYSAVKGMGFGSKTGIELPAETGGIVRPVSSWNGDSLASMSIGYEIGVSALQMATAFATIANDGIRIQPHIIKEIRNADGSVVSVAQPEKKRVVSAETARDLRAMLRQVVLAGTGKRAQVNGYSTAGKTGTAWKFDEKLKRVNSAKYVSSFIGFAPFDNPEVTIAVVMDEPKIGGRDGGSAAAPVFSEIAARILPELQIRPDLGEMPDQFVAEEIPESIGNGEGTPYSETDADSDQHAVKPETLPVPKAGIVKPTTDNSNATASFPRPKPDAKTKIPLKVTTKRVETENRN